MTHRHGSLRRWQYYDDYSLGILRISLELFALVAIHLLVHLIEIFLKDTLYRSSNALEYSRQDITHNYSIWCVCQISLKSCVVRSRKSLSSNRWHYSSATWILHATQVCYCCVGTKPCIPYSSSGTRLWATDYQYTGVKVHPSKPNG